MARKTRPAARSPASGRARARRRLIVAERRDIRGSVTRWGRWGGAGIPGSGRRVLLHRQAVTLAWTAHPARRRPRDLALVAAVLFLTTGRSEEHTSELQSPCTLVCRLLLE